MSINRRLAKLEEHHRSMATPNRPPGVPEGVMDQARRVAATCERWQDVSDFLKTLMSDEGEVVSLDRKRQTDAVVDAFARGLFEEVRAS